MKRIQDLTDLGEDRSGKGVEALKNQICGQKGKWQGRAAVRLGWQGGVSTWSPDSTAH